MTLFAGAGQGQSRTQYIQDFQRTKDRLRFGEKVAVGSVEILGVLSSEFQMLCLIMPNRYVGSPSDG